VAVSVVCRDPCYQSPWELRWSKFTRSCSNRVGFYNFFSLCGPQKQLITVETRLFLFLFAEIHVTRELWELWWSKFTRSCSNTAESYASLDYIPSTSLSFKGTFPPLI
jgi:hypothetical protein